MYTLLPFVAFIVLKEVIDVKAYDNGMKLILVSVTVITILGWLIFFNLIDRDFVTNLTNEGNFVLGIGVYDMKRQPGMLIIYTLFWGFV